MANVLDVAAYILRKKPYITAMKLQKLCYYAQAWSLVWDDRPLFREHIEAWAHGPVVPRLYRCHSGSFRVNKDCIPGDPGTLTKDERETIEAVLKTYGAKSSQWLSELTHLESPWKDARKGLKPGERGSNEITRASMAEYYGSL